jgi:MFS family permease
MHSLLKKRFDDFSETEFEYVFHLMYSVYSLPNVILPIVGGVLIYKFGYRLMFLIFGFCVLLGQLLFSLGCSTHSVPLMLLGRIIFGLGGESLNTTQYAIIVEWFAVNQIAFALGVCLSFARFGNVLNDVISPRIATVFYYNSEF